MFIDEFYVFMGVGGGEGFVVVFNMLKLMLVCGELWLIGVIIFNEYCEFIEKDVVFECCF